MLIYDLQVGIPTELVETIFNKAETIQTEFEENVFVDVMHLKQLKVNIKNNNVKPIDIKRWFYNYRKQFKFIKPTLRVISETEILITF